MSGDGMDHLRIPLEKIEFGRKLEVQGYGTIYEGEFDGQKVALKQLNITNLVNVKPRLLAEILAISRFREHPNVVALLGFCDEKSNEIILVYEYVGSGNLADKMRKRLNTIQRLEICVGAARGLDYLHTGVDESSSAPVSCIVHGNIKPSKILLYSNSNSTGFDAKVSSFGLSKVVPGQSRKNLEPVEPATKESDVYSFGVLLLEVLCGVSELVDTDDYQERHVSELVPKRLEQNKLRKVVHFDIRKEIKEPALETYAKIACECVNESPEARPTMARVVEELEKALVLQGGVVSPVHIPSSINVTQNETVVEVGPKEDDNGVTVDSNVPENEPEVKGEDKLDVAREYNSDAIVSETTEEQSPLVSVSEGESVNGTTDAQKESSNNEPSTIDNISSNKETTKDDNQTKTDIELLDNGGVVAPVHIPSSINVAPNGTIVEAGPKEDDNGVMKDSNEPEDAKDPIIDNAVASETMDEESSLISVSDSVEGESVNDTLDAQKESSNNEPLNKYDISSKKESAILDNEVHSSVIVESGSRDFGALGDELEKGLKLQEDQSSNVPISDVIDAESIPETTHIKDAESIPETTHFKDAESIPETTHFKDAESIPETNHFKDAESIPETNHFKDAESIPETTHFEDAQEKSSNDVSITTNGRETTSEVINEVVELEDLRIPYDEIKFGKKIDTRGYGTLFEGEYNNEQVALKRLNITNLNNIKPKLLDEVLTVARFRKHPNVVALIGFSDEKSNEIVLVYEYVKSGNLADKMNKHLNTIQRLEICLGAARGLEYLHTGLVHGHIKLSKILLKSDSNSSRFEAKVSGFGFSRLLPGDVQIAPRSLNPVAKESDVYTFGVLLLEVLCGVPELVDTDDYQERHVTEVVPKRLEQDMLRKIVHFDIRNEIKTEALETYAKIACRSVVKNPEERPSMTEVVVELEKALRLQGGEVSGIHILGTKETVVEVDQPEDDKPIEEPNVVDETIANDETEESKVVDETIDDVVEAKPNEEPVIIVKNDIDNDNIEVPTPEESKNDAESNSSKLLHSFHRPVLASEEEKDNKDDTESKEETMENKITPLEITTGQQVDQNDGKLSVLLKTGAEPELSVNTRGYFDNFNPDETLIPVEKPEVSEIKRSNSACSESSNDDGTTPSDYLLPKSPTNGTTKKKTLTSTGNCCCCSWMCFICDSIVIYGGQLWDKLVSCFAWIGGQCSSKTD